MSDAKQSPVTRRRLEKELPTDLTKKAETEQVETEQAGIDKRRPSNEIVIVKPWELVAVILLMAAAVVWIIKAHKILQRENLIA